MMKWLVLMPNLRVAKMNFDKLKFARDAYTVGRHPSIKDGLGFRREVKNLTSQRAPISAKDKGKAPMTSSNQKNHAFIYDRKFSRNTYHNRSLNAYNSHAMFGSSSSFVHGRNMPRNNVVHHVPKKMQNKSAIVFGPIPCMPLKNILIPCMPLAPHVIDTKKYTYMPLSGTQGMSIKSDGIPGIFSLFFMPATLILYFHVKKESGS
jgi:hypothetical protein